MRDFIASNVAVGSVPLQTDAVRGMRDGAQTAGGAGNYEARKKKRREKAKNEAIDKRKVRFFPFEDKRKRGMNVGIYGRREYFLT